MNIQINNLGPIKRGEIPLNSSLLFFVGFNNSGKSYATQLIWAIYNEKFRIDFLRSLNLNSITKVRKVDNFKFNQQIANKIIEAFEKYIEDKIHSIFNLGKNEFKNFKIKFVFEENEINNLIKSHSEEFRFLSYRDSSKKVIITRDGNQVISIKGDIDHFEIDEIKLKVIEFCFFSLFVGEQSFFLPAIRGAYVNLFQYINKFEKEKKDYIDKYINDNTKIKLESVLEVIEESKSSYTLATNLLINKLTNLNLETEKSDKYEHFQNIVKEMIGGEIIKKDYSLLANNSKFFLNINKNELPMHVSSSTTNQLAPLYLFFKYWGHKYLNDMLIIDEPEENLHPENQIKFLEMMFQFVSEGNKAVITTHSILLTKALNSHIAFNELTKENQEKIIEETGFKHFPQINKSNVKVCFFNGEEILPYPVNEYGTVFHDFVKVEENVNSHFRIITNKLFDQNE